jgi:hypothetical protein
MNKMMYEDIVSPSYFDKDDKRRDRSDSREKKDKRKRDKDDKKESKG